uniref:Uncharacterized protein n=1 Tax=Chrysotila carterae TaxID=13221 RepID=A0A7S4BLL6_CHRCT
MPFQRCVQFRQCGATIGIVLALLQGVVVLRTIMMLGSSAHFQQNLLEGGPALADPAHDHANVRTSKKVVNLVGQMAVGTPLANFDTGDNSVQQESDASERLDLVPQDKFIGKNEVSLKSSPVDFVHGLQISVQATEEGIHESTAEAGIEQMAAVASEQVAEEAVDEGVHQTAQEVGKVAADRQVDETKAEVVSTPAEAAEKANSNSLEPDLRPDAGDTAPVGRDAQHKGEVEISASNGLLFHANSAPPSKARHDGAADQLVHAEAAVAKSSNGQEEGRVEAGSREPGARSNAAVKQTGATAAQDSSGGAGGGAAATGVGLTSAAAAADITAMASSRELRGGKGNSANFPWAKLTSDDLKQEVHARGCRAVDLQALSSENASIAAQQIAELGLRSERPFFLRLFIARGVIDQLRFIWHSVIEALVEDGVAVLPEAVAATQGGPAGGNVSFRVSSLSELWELDRLVVHLYCKVGIVAARPGHSGISINYGADAHGVRIGSRALRDRIGEKRVETRVGAPLLSTAPLVYPFHFSRALSILQEQELRDVGLAHQAVLNTADLPARLLMRLWQIHCRALWPTPPLLSRVVGAMAAIQKRLKSSREGTKAKEAQLVGVVLDSGAASISGSSLERWLEDAGMATARRANAAVVQSALVAEQESMIYFGPANALARNGSERGVREHFRARSPERQLYATLSELELAKSAGASVSSEASAAWIDEAADAMVLLLSDVLVGHSIGKDFKDIRLRRCAMVSGPRILSQAVTKASLTQQLALRLPFKTSYMKRNTRVDRLDAEVKARTCDCGSVAFVLIRQFTLPAASCSVEKDQYSPWADSASFSLKARLPLLFPTTYAATLAELFVKSLRECESDSAAVLIL